MGYDYLQLIESINAVAKKYGFIDVFNIGKSVMGRGILCIKIGKGKKKILLAGAFHGLEFITAALLMRFTEDYAEHISKHKCFLGYNADELLKRVSLFIVPMVNPDGVDIAVNGICLTNKYHIKLTELAGICDFKKEWQANVRGVDLNHNYDAKWQRVTDSCAPSKYGGEYPESEPETKAVVSLVRKEYFDMLIAFHSQGREIYFDFDGIVPENSKEIAKRMSQKSSYKVCKPIGTAAFGGCKDWFIKEFNKPGFTIEVGTGKNPLPVEMLEGIYKENALMILCAMEKA